jgi:hypothetical protein
MRRAKREMARLAAKEAAPGTGAPADKPEVPKEKATGSAAAGGGGS